MRLFKRPRKAHGYLDLLKNADIKTGADHRMRINTLYGVQKEDWLGPRSFLYRVFQLTDNLINRIRSQMD